MISYLLYTLLSDLSMYFANLSDFRIFVNFFADFSRFVEQISVPETENAVRGFPDGRLNGKDSFFEGLGKVARPKIGMLAPMGRPRHSPLGTTCQ